MDGDRHHTLSRFVVVHSNVLSRNLHGKGLHSVIAYLPRLRLPKRPLSG